MENFPKPKKNFILEEDDDEIHLSRKQWFARAETYMAIAGFSLFTLILLYFLRGSGENNPYLQGSGSSEVVEDSNSDESKSDSSDETPVDDQSNDSGDADSGDDSEDEDDDSDEIKETDDVSIVRAAVNGASIDLTLTYPGCGDHDFDLALDSIDEDENPVQLNVLVIHDANGDDCEIGNESVETLDLSGILSEADNPRAYTMNLIDSSGNGIDFKVQ